ncbi:acyl-CoA dehydrogenase family protein [Mycobacterium sp. 94-17]|uniref:acyl-CoA dehydrogenase family protein n=1 Tax=Mycobacterium sp. 94-17 TaxID=2986147 RepID=UPI002D1F5557|nr:acyl-CoA dehydrogenase family protein [Mycobacterium sp. 94-17]MEB4209752.1 acyl-CoA dehydrogenase family protein [Mycobacterium sp. 94-17]
MRVLAGTDTSPQDASAAALAWVEQHVPESWRVAALHGGPAAVRGVRTPTEYRSWYPEFGRSGLAAPMWATEHGGLGWGRKTARAVEQVLAPYHLPRLNPLGLNLAAPALFAHGSEAQRRRFLPKIVTAEEIWCQLFSEPGSGSDLASLSTRADRDGEDWVLNGRKIWTTWADRAHFAVCLARTNPDLPKHQGITYFLVDMHQPGVQVHPLRHIGGEVEFFETTIDGARVPDAHRVGDVGAGWKVAQATLSGERQMVSGSGSGGVDRIGGTGVSRLIEDACARADAALPNSWLDAAVRDRLVRLWCEEQVRGWTNLRIRERLANNLAPGPESSIGKVHGADLNQRIQAAAAELLGPAGIAWSGDSDDPDTFAATMPPQVRGMLRSRANTIEGGTTEVNKNVLAERVLGLPKETDPWRGKPWRELPRS